MLLLHLTVHIQQYKTQCSCPRPFRNSSPNRRLHRSWVGCLVSELPAALTAKSTHAVLKLQPNTIFYRACGVSTLNSPSWIRTVLSCALHRSVFHERVPGNALPYACAPQGKGVFPDPRCDPPTTPIRSSHASETTPVLCPSASMVLTAFVTCTTVPLI